MKVPQCPEFQLVEMHYKAKGICSPSNSLVFCALFSSVTTSIAQAQNQATELADCRHIANSVSAGVSNLRMHPFKR